MSGEYGASVRPSIPVAKVLAHAHAHVGMEEDPELIGIALDLSTKQWLVIQFRAMVLPSFLSLLYMKKMRKNMHFYTKIFKNRYVSCDFTYTYIAYFTYSVIVSSHFISFYRNGTPKGRRKIRRGSGRDVPQSFQDMDAGLWREVDPTVS